MAAIVNFRDLLLQGSPTRYVPPATAFDPSTLGDLALLDTVGTPQIQPGSITAGSGIVAPGAILTQALAPNAATNTKSYSSSGPTVLTAGGVLGGAAEVVVATFPTYGSKGGTAVICFGMRTSWSGLYEPQVVTDNQLIVRRNGFVIYTLDQVPLGIVNLPPVVDTTVNGTPVSYTISVKVVNFWTGDGPIDWNCNERSAFLLEAIR